MGPCAKTVVTCTLVTRNGEQITGQNLCRNPQHTCPREPGEGYEKCKTICDQVGHAEVVALSLAGPKAAGARAYLLGHTYVCQQCQVALFSAGVNSISVGVLPEEAASSVDVDAPARDIIAKELAAVLFVDLSDADHRLRRSIDVTAARVESALVSSGFRIEREEAA